MGLWSKTITRTKTCDIRRESYKWNISKLNIIKNTLDLMVANIRRYPKKTCEYQVKSYSVKWNILGYDICEYFYRDDYVDNERLMMGKIMVKIFDMLQEHNFIEISKTLTFDQLHQRLARVLSYAPTDEDKFWTYIENVMDNNLTN